MVIEKNAMAGTLESSDAQVMVEPGDTLGLETLERLDVKSGTITIVDKGALDCTIKARVSLTPDRSPWYTRYLPPSRRRSRTRRSW